jgi:hypothetical protein
MTCLNTTKAVQDPNNTIDILPQSPKVTVKQKLMKNRVYNSLNIAKKVPLRIETEETVIFDTENTRQANFSGQVSDFIATEVDVDKHLEIIAKISRNSSKRDQDT